MASPRLIMKLRVTDVRSEPGDVNVIELRHSRRPELPPFDAGSHVDVHIPDGKIRQYSLMGDPADRSRYIIGIKREPGGRGGSDWLHGNVAVGAELPVSAPRSHFGLAAKATSHLLLAGGIGITPLMAMSKTLRAKGDPFVLHYFARGRWAAPMLRELQTDFSPANLQVHLDDEEETRADIASLLATPEPGQHLYYCGPPGFMTAVRAAAASWPTGTVHFEAFQLPADENFAPAPFSLELRSSGRTLLVPKDLSALQVLQDAGVALKSSCENGVCGSCECGFVSGQPIHRDAVLTEDAKSQRFIPCVSRAQGAIVLDL